MPVINRFGQRVKIEIFSASKELIFGTEELRVDFDIRVLPGYARAKIDIYNLAPDAIKNITTSTAFVSISAALHEGEYKLVANQLYISNAYEQTLVPDSVTQLFCYPKLKYSLLEKVIDIKVPNPSFKNVAESVLLAGKFKGKPTYSGFPTNFIDMVPPNNVSNQRGSVESLLTKLCNQAGVYMYPDGDIMHFVYKVDSNNVSTTNFKKKDKMLTLDTNNMRGQPEIGIAQLNISSNLDTSIAAGVVVDVTQLLTASAGVSQKKLETSDKILQDKVANNSSFQVLQVQHKGSNWTKEWMTSAIAYAPNPGTHMNKHGWFN